MIWMVVYRMAYRTIIFVANVNVNDDGSLKVNVNRLSNDNVWNAEYRHRIVVPKLVVSLITMW